MTLLLAFLLAGCGGSLQKTATDHAARGAWDEGIEFFRKKFNGRQNLAIKHFYIHRHVLQFYHKQGKLQDGLAFYQKFKDKALVAYITGVYYYFQMMYDKALVSLEEAAALRPGEFIIHYDLALVQRGLRQFGAARRSLARCLKLNSSYGPAYYEMGMHYAFHPTEASIGSAFFKQALSHYGDFGTDALDVKISLGMVHVHENRIGDAVSVWEDVAAADFMKLVRSVDLGDLYWKQDKKDKARDFWKRAVGALGHNSLRGRYFFYRLHTAGQTGADFSGLAYSYVTTSAGNDDTIVLADEEEFFFNNNPEKPLTHDKLLADGLSDGRMGTEYWKCEYAGIMTRPEPVYRFLQSRGLVETIPFSDGRKLLVSVSKQKLEIRTKTDKDNIEYQNYWRRADAQFGVYSPASGRMQKLSFPCSHFHKAALVDVDGDGRQDVLAAGFDNDGRMIVSLWTDRNGNWQQYPLLQSGLRSRNNGFVFVDLDGKPGLELVSYSAAISWADVYRIRRNDYVKDNALYTGFAADFYREYSFFVPGYTDRTFRNTVLEPARREQYLAIEEHLPLARSILGRSALP